MRPRKTAHEMLGQRVEPILADGVYYLSELPRLLRVGRDSLDEEIKAGRLAHGEVAGRYLFRGSWLLAWLEGTKVGPGGEEVSQDGKARKRCVG